jgi:hypothetical protein
MRPCARSVRRGLPSPPWPGSWASAAQRVCLPPSKHAARPQTASAAAISPRADPVSPLSNAALAGELSGESAAQAGDSRAGFRPFAPDGLPLHHLTAARERRGMCARVTRLAVYPPSRTVCQGGVVRHGVPASSSVGRRTAAMTKHCQVAWIVLYNAIPRSPKWRENQLFDDLHS